MKNLILTSLTFLVLGCSNPAENEPMKNQAAMADVSPSSLEEPKDEHPNETGVISVQGMVDVPPNQQASIQPYFEGYVKDINVLNGSLVSKGDLLFTMVNPKFLDVQRDYLTHLARMNYLEQDLTRKKILNKEQITADLLLQQVEMEYEIAKASLQSTKKTLELMNISPSQIVGGKISASIHIYAPINGAVENLSITTGEFLNQGKKAADIINADHLHLELKVFEKDAFNIEEGQKVTFRLPEVSDSTYEAVIYLISNTIDPKTRTVNVHAHVENEQLRLLPGMFVEAEISF